MCFSKSSPAKYEITIKARTRLFGIRNYFHKLSLNNLLDKLLYLGGGVQNLAV